MIARVSRRRVSRAMASERLKLGVRQVKRLVRTYRERGAAGWCRGRRGHAPNHQRAAGVGARARNVLSGGYRDFGSTLAAENLAARESLVISRETVESPIPR